MRVCLRLLIIWLTALALPLQSLAAVTMFHCGPSHERMHLHDAHDAHDLPDCAHAPLNPSRALIDQPTASVETTGLAQYSCGACASCCTGLALLRLMPQVPEPTPVAQAFAVQVPDIAEVARPGPDRPPRLGIA